MSSIPDLASLHERGDAPADELVASLYAAGEIRSINRALDAVSVEGVPFPEDLDPNVAEWLLASQSLPAWAEPDRIERAQRTFARHGVVLGVALMYGSLPSLYAGALGGVQVLAMTQQLHKHFRRRAAQTLRFILDVMGENGLEPGTRGVRTAQKVRLMHASIRHFARTSGRWAALPQWGAPINQEELLGTLLSFSVLACDNARRMGVELSRDEEDDLWHAWRCVGHLMGIVPEALPETICAARATWTEIVKRNFRPTPEAKQLAQDHLAFLDELVPGQALDAVNLALMRWLLGKQVGVECLGLAKAPWWTRILEVLRALVGLSSRLLEVAKPFDPLMEAVNTELIEGLEKLWADGEQIPFRLPETINAGGTHV
jgi:ER-bound oxygenase mpaB/B'/Rubber oxygenase, catalytic domain